MDGAIQWMKIWESVEIEKKMSIKNINNSFFITEKLKMHLVDVKCILFFERKVCRTKVL